MAWTVEQIAQRFLDFMVERGHVVIEGHSVRSPTDDVLFTTAGMHPLTPYLLGQPHPAGRRLCDVQRCVRTTDIDEVGDNRHLTVFEMLGNWSLGDYFKETSIPQSFELLTEDFGIDPRSLYVTVFGGSDQVPADAESPDIWRQVFSDAGVDPTGRINPLGEEDNWWSNGPTGPCGPDTEMFLWVGEGDPPPFADIPEYIEMWNNVFMSYNRAEDGKLTQLTQRNVDTGMGLERIAVFLNGHSSVWQTDELARLLEVVAEQLNVKPSDARRIGRPFAARRDRPHQGGAGDCRGGHPPCRDAARATSSASSCGAPSATPSCCSARIAASAQRSARRPPTCPT